MEEITWAKARKLIRQAEVGYLHTDGSLVIRTEEHFRGTKVDVWTEIKAFVPAFSVTIYGHKDNGGYNNWSSDKPARVVFFWRTGGAKGALAIARPTRAHVWVGDGSENSKKAGINHCGLKLSYATGDEIQFGYLSRPEISGGIINYDSHLVSNDFEIQLGDNVLARTTEANEVFALKPIEE